MLIQDRVTTVIKCQLQSFVIHSSEHSQSINMLSCYTRTHARTHAHTHTHTHTHRFNGPLSGTTQVSRYQKGKTNLDFTEARQ